MTLPRSTWSTLALGAVLALGCAFGCAPAEEDGIPITGATPPSTETGIKGGVQQGKTATPTPKPTPPVVEATPSVIASVNVSQQYLLLMLPARDGQPSLGNPSEATLLGQAQRKDGGEASVRWIDRSSGAVTVSADGHVKATAASPAGFYTVRCEAIDDAQVFKDVTVEVRGSGELEVIVQ
jgi:hypothetical protein